MAPHSRDIDACIQWPLQAGDFSWDGSLRDIYVPEVSLEDWRRVLRLIQQGPYAAEFLVEGSPQPFPDDVFALFRDPTTRPGPLGFSVGGVHLACHFFTPEEIEFDLDPREVTETTLPALLHFMADLGDATGKTVVLTPENCREAPVFRYDAARRQMAWVPWSAPWQLARGQADDRSPRPASSAPPVHLAGGKAGQDGLVPSAPSARGHCRRAALPGRARQDPPGRDPVRR